MSADGSIPQPEGPLPRLRGFNELMRHRVLRILLVTSLYDSFIMSEEGHLQESLLSQFLALNLSHLPALRQVPSISEAIHVLREDSSFDLVISSVRTTDGEVGDLVRALDISRIEVPVIALAQTSRDLHDYLAKPDREEVERVFVWQGDVRILLAMVKGLEDRLNVEHDTGETGVPAIIVVEDNVRFYSSFLPVIYTELFKHLHNLLSEDLNLSQKMMRMRARPKVLLCESYEEAWHYFESYEQHVLGVISDCEFPRGGELQRDAGFQLCEKVLERRPDIRVVLQSSRSENRDRASGMGASFLLKGSPTLLHELRDLLVKRFGFGDFIFRNPAQVEIDRAHDLRSLADKLRTVPAESVAYHAERNHFSFWLKARIEFELAERLRPVKVTDFEDTEAIRRFALEKIDETRLEKHRSVIADFERESFEPSVSITRIGEGSLGGKARGVAFANRVLRASHLAEEFPSVDVHVPPSVVIGAQVFDDFLEYGGLGDFALASMSDHRILASFQDAPFPRRAVMDLRNFLQRVDYPLAVRSSSLLEDSLAQPFAGVYQTLFVPNNDPSFDVRLEQLKSAIKQVYASTFMSRAKTYHSMTSFRLEEEKMAVMVQELVGARHGDRFYPDFAGVARSHNFYPEPGQRPEDGVVAIAVGMGRTVVDGSPCLRFCPAYPQQIVSMSSVESVLEYTQRNFQALDLGRHEHGAGLVGLRSHPIDLAEADGVLQWSGSTWSPDDNRIVDGISRSGVRLVTFAQVLKHESYPLAPLVARLLRECSEATGGPVEIEFAGMLGPVRGARPSFGFLQLRPLAMAGEQDAVEIGEVDSDRVLCRSDQILGNGLFDDLRDIVVVDAETFDRAKSPEIAQDVARFDARLRKDGRPYLLIGVGRWGSADASLGIPVRWDQIAGAKVIVESGFKDIRVAPSQGTHFFQNLTSCNVGYFTIDPDQGKGELDWGWLAAQESEERSEYVRHLRLAEPLTIKLSAAEGAGVILI